MFPKFSLTATSYEGNKITVIDISFQTWKYSLQFYSYSTKSSVSK